VPVRASCVTAKGFGAAAGSRRRAACELRLAAPAAAPLQPVSPDRLLVALFGALALGSGALLAALWAERRRLDALGFEL